MMKFIRKKKERKVTTGIWSSTFEHVDFTEVLWGS